MNREPPPPGIVAAAEQEYHGMRDTLATLTRMVRDLLTEQFTEVQAVGDVWLTLMCQDPRAAALLGAIAIVQLAKLEDRRGPMSSVPGS